MGYVFYLQILNIVDLIALIKMSWNAEKEQKLRELWKKGHSGSEIANMLGNTTRNAVIGKAHRLKLESRSVSRKSDAKVNTKKNNLPATKTTKLGRKARFKALLLDKNFEAENPKKFEELTEQTCKWPIGHPNEENFYFCGRQSLEKFPYCKLHLLYAYQPKNAKEEDILNEEDVAKYIDKKAKTA
jgi:GcrA cell cycle regulator